MGLGCVVAEVQHRDSCTLVVTWGHGEFWLRVCSTMDFLGKLVLGSLGRIRRDALWLSSVLLG